MFYILPYLELFLVYITSRTSWFFLLSLIIGFVSNRFDLWQPCMDSSVLATGDHSSSHANPPFSILPMAAWKIGLVRPLYMLKLLLYS